MLIGIQAAFAGQDECVRSFGDAGDGDWRVRLLERARPDMLSDLQVRRGHGELPVVLRVRARLRVFPELQHRVDHVQGNLALAAGAGIDPDDLKVPDEATRADAEQEPSARHVVELGDAVGEVERVVVRQAGNAGRELDT